MATILNGYSISGGDTTSSTFTSNGDCVKVEATTTNINGNNAFIQIQSSDDQSTWKDIDQVKFLPGSDIYCSDPSTITGLYVRVKLICNDANNGSITITASNESTTTDGTVPVNAKVTLTANQIAHLFSSPIDIPEYPAVEGKYWIITAWTALQFTPGQNGFDNELYIKAEAASASQGVILTSMISGGDLFCSIRPTTGENSIAVESGLQLTANDNDTNNGDGTAIIYISAFLITA